MQVFHENLDCEAPLQLLLFVDERPSSREQIQKVQQYLQSSQADAAPQLQIVEVGEHPYLVEHFKLVATPALVKVHPSPLQVIAGSDLVSQLDLCWSRWQRSVENFLASGTTSRPETEKNGQKQPGISSVLHSAELLRLSDEIFRLKQDKQALQEQLQFKDRIIAMLAHDLRNPLTAASIAIETLELAFNPEGEQHNRLTPALTAQLLRHARTQIRTIEQMITDILQAARGASTELHIKPEILDIGTLCKDVLEDFENRLQAKLQTLETDIPQDLPPVYADQERVRQVIANLVDNAIKYTPEQGRIQVSVLHRTTQKIQVSICDDGPGIPEVNRQRIFEENFRLQRDEAKEGFGLGLALCQRLIRAHYGRIWVGSAAGQGSCFHFTLPVYRL